jgi:hypothetical protein
VSYGIVLVLLAVVSIALAKASQSESPSLQIIPPGPQTVVAGENFNFALVVQGGFPPYTWSLTEGNLPPGLKLHPHKGIISGVPTTPGEYHFKLAIADSNIPHQQFQCDYTINVIVGLTIDWKQPPKVQGNTISGSAVVSNQTGHSLDVTVVVVAVNKIGRATALGYQHFSLAAQGSSPLIPFGSSPGMGTYTIRADASAHRKSGHHIFRASKQTPDTLEVTQF